VLASITEQEIRALAESSVLFRNVITDIVLMPVFAACPSTLADWEDVCGSRSGDLSLPTSQRDRPFPRLVNEDRKAERNVGGQLYPRAICPECEKRVPVVVRRNDSLAYRSHGSCAAAGRTVEPERVIGWGTFGHLAPVSAPGGMVSG
jgi:hypothetical protein